MVIIFDKKQAKKKRFIATL